VQVHHDEGVANRIVSLSASRMSPPAATRRIAQPSDKRRPDGQSDLNLGHSGSFAPAGLPLFQGVRVGLFNRQASLSDDMVVLLRY
jgi:hypothetical protein